MSTPKDQVAVAFVPTALFDQPAGNAPALKSSSMIRQLSEVITGSGTVTSAPHSPASLSTEISAGQAIVGAWLSITVTVKEQEAVLPAASVAVYSSVVAPTGKKLVLPMPAVRAIVTPGQLSLYEGAPYSR